jgi:phage repressor protein C with HTH and peptisase S24 domain
MGLVHCYDWVFAMSAAVLPGGTVPAENRAVSERTERLREAVREAGGPSAVAKRAEMHLGTLNNYLGGRDMKAASMISLAEATGVRLEWLASGTGPMRADGTGFAEETAAFSAGHARQAPEGGVLIPRYEARASAGIGTTLDPGWAIEKVMFSAEFIRTKLRRNPEHLALIECSGDSMEPALRDGDELLVDTSATEPRSGPIYILRVGGALLAKRVQPRMDGTVMILSDNPRYPPEVITPSDATPLDVVGEVLWRSGTLR